MKKKVVTKIWNCYHSASSVRPMLDRQLKDLGLDYVDLYHIHCKRGSATNETSSFTMMKLTENSPQSRSQLSLWIQISIIRPPGSDRMERKWKWNDLHCKTCIESWRRLSTTERSEISE